MSLSPFDFPPSIITSRSALIGIFVCKVTLHTWNVGAAVDNFLVLPLFGVYCACAFVSSLSLFQAVQAQLMRKRKQTGKRKTEVFLPDVLALAVVSDFVLVDECNTGVELRFIGQGRTRKTAHKTGYIRQFLRPFPTSSRH